LEGTVTIPKLLLHVSLGRQAKQWVQY
jgi:hypothetical protein